MPKSEWTDEAVLKLIELWKKEYALYEYHDKAARVKAISKITKNLKPLLPNVSYNAVKYKMQNLRGHYTRLLSQVLYSTHDDNGPNSQIYKPQWFWYEKMSFLGDVVCNGRHSAALKNLENQKSDAQGGESDEKYIEYEEATNSAIDENQPKNIVKSEEINAKKEEMNECLIEPHSPTKQQTQHLIHSPVPVPAPAPLEERRRSQSVDSESSSMSCFGEFLEELPAAWEDLEDKITSPKMLFNYRSPSLCLSESSVKHEEPLPDAMVVESREVTFCNFLLTELTQIENEKIKCALMENITSLVFSAKKNDKDLRQ